jgi:hypothetical protein
MARLDFALIAQVVSVDRDSNSLSIINVIDELAVGRETPDPPKGKAIPGGFSLSVVAVWYRSSADKPETGEARVQLIGPNSKRPVGQAQTPLDLSGTIQRARTIFRMQFLPYQGPGTYTFVVQVTAGGGKWRRVGSRTVQIKKAE